MPAGLFNATSKVVVEPDNRKIIATYDAPMVELYVTKVGKASKKKPDGAISLLRMITASWGTN